MSYKFNPFSGNFDDVGSGGGGNPFDQSLNTSNAVNFASVTTAIPDADSSYIAPSGIGGGNLNSGGSWSFNSSGNGELSGYFVCGSISVNGKTPAFLSDGNAFTAGQSIAAAANTSALTASYSVTGANTTPLLDLSGTWNTTGVATGIKLNITDTASNATSRLLDLQRGGSSVFNVSKFGTLTCGQITTAGSQISCGQINIGSSNQLNWNFDTVIQRDGAANTIAQRNGTNANTFRLYGTYSDASNGRRLDITSTTGGIFTLTATGNGTGAIGNLLKLTAPILLPASSVTLATNGDLAFEATSNTTLTIRYRGSDGTTRSAAITLA